MKQRQIIFDFQKGEELRDAGMKLASDHADAVSREWCSRARIFFNEFLLSHDEKFLSEDVRAYAHNVKGFEFPPDSRAWGTIFREAAKAGRIKRLGYEPCRDPISHRSPNSVWIKVKIEEDQI